MRFVLADEFDLETFNGVVHDGRYGLSNITLCPETQKLAILCEMEVYELVSGIDPALVMPKAHDYVAKIRHIIIEFAGATDCAIEDEAQIDVGDIAKVALSGDKIVIVGSLPVTLTITARPPYVATVQRIPDPQ